MDGLAGQSIPEIMFIAAIIGMILIVIYFLIKHKEVKQNENHKG